MWFNMKVLITTNDNDIEMQSLSITDTSTDTPNISTDTPNISTDTPNISTDTPNISTDTPKDINASGDIKHGGYCSICLNTADLHFTKLHCCGQTIHEKCLINWIYLQSSITVTCPICRGHITSLSPIISIDNFLIHLNSLLSNQVVYCNKIKRIICSLYNDPIVDCFRDSDNTIINISDNSNNTICTCTNVITYLILSFIMLIVLLFIINIVNSSSGSGYSSGSGSGYSSGSSSGFNTKLESILLYT
jgi:hypothetical protein